MKRTDITYQDKFNELRLDITHPNSKGINFIFVEGESDIKLFRKLFALDKCKVENIPGGKDKVEECVANLLPLCKLVIAVRDADFIHLDDAEYSKANVFLTDCHDIEMTMLAQKTVLNAVIGEYSGLSEQDSALLFENIMKSIEMVSYLKWLNDKENLELTFAGSGFLDLIDFSEFKVDLAVYLQRILGKSTNAKITDKQIINDKIADLTHDNPDLIQLTNGHDLLNTLARYFRDVIKHKGLSDENIASSLRIAFTMTHFKETHLYQQLVNWQEQNQTVLFPMNT